MNLLVTAGNTLVLIDRARCLTNIFTGRTGAAIALHAHGRGHAVTLLTSHPEAVDDLRASAPRGTSDIPVGPSQASPTGMSDVLRDGSALPADRWSVVRYQTFEDLQDRMKERIAGGGFDGVVHCAAVSDYLSAGVFAPAPGTRFHAQDGRWEGPADEPPTLSDRRAGKVKSDEPELWLRLVRAPKLIDRIRLDWGFRGLLVKFKLEVGVTDERLLEIAEASRRHSAADLMVANTLEGSGHYAFLGPLDGRYQRVSRRELAPRLLDTLEQLHATRPHG
jgi:phosphopantothenoylcysteine synthetase/decarboxylase